MISVQGFRHVGFWGIVVDLGLLAGWDVWSFGVQGGLVIFGSLRKFGVPYFGVLIIKDPTI